MRNILRKNLKNTREAERIHDQKMSIICQRGGITLNQLRAMSMRNKDNFITQYRNKESSDE